MWFVDSFKMKFLETVAHREWTDVEGTVALEMHALGARDDFGGVFRGRTRLDSSLKFRGRGESPSHRWSYAEDSEFTCVGATVIYRITNREAHVQASTTYYNYREQPARPRMTTEGQPSTLEKSLDSDVQEDHPTENLQLRVQPMVHVGDAVDGAFEPPSGSLSRLDVWWRCACGAVSAQLVSFSREICSRSLLARRASKVSQRLIQPAVDKNRSGYSVPVGGERHTLCQHHESYPFVSSP